MGHVINAVTRSGLTRTQVNEMINDRVFSARDRKILRMKLLDGCTYEYIAEEIKPQMSPRQIKRIVSRCVADLKLNP